MKSQEDDVWKDYDEALMAMGLCKCGHNAPHHWHNGPIERINVSECSVMLDSGTWKCGCQKFEKARE